MAAQGTMPTTELTLPTAPDAEDGLVGSVLNDPDQFAIVRDEVGIGSRDFFLVANQLLWSTCEELTKERRVIDVTTVTERLRAAHNLGEGPKQCAFAHIQRVYGNVAHGLNAPDYARAVADASDKRTLTLRFEELRAMSANGESPVNVISFNRRMLDVIEKRRGAGVRLQTLDTVQEKRVGWSWPGRIPLAKLSVLSGQPGLGKTFVTCDYIARITTGAPFPDCPDEPWADPGGVLLVNAEDDAADTLVPRLNAAEADLSKVCILPDGDVASLAKDHGKLRRGIEKMGNCRLLVIDPIGSFMGGSDTHSDAETRTALRPLIEIAAEFNIAVLIVAHLRKSGGKAIDRTMGSVAFVGMARAAWMVIQDADNPKRRLLLRQKCNLSDVTDGLAFRLENRHGHNAPYVSWEAAPVTITADEAFEKQDNRGRPKGKDKLGEAKEWLREFIGEGEKLASDVIHAGAAKGLGEPVIRKAFNDLCGLKRRTGFQGPSHWSFAKDTDTPPENEF